MSVRIASKATLGEWSVVPRAAFAWQWAFGDVNPARGLAFADGGEGSMSIRGVPIARNSALITLIPPSAEAVSDHLV